MSTRPEEGKESFKDFYLVLQLHPEADAGMVEAAYWHLARRYNEAAIADASARAQLDSLNEAYSVLGSPTRRDAYNQMRNEVLGSGALPSPPPPEPEPAPLAVMAKRRPTQPDDAAEPRVRRSETGYRPVSLPLWQGLVTAVIVLALASAALGFWAQPGAVAALLALGILLAVSPLLRKPPRLGVPSLHLPSRPVDRPIKPSPADPAQARLTPEGIRRSTKALQARLREGSAAARTPDGPPSPSTQPLQQSDGSADKETAA